ncbi:hypothetical protein [Burkholderia sp. F1]|uniref:hypothetical protein n=1 Tax=Burkholderia sp. F1 TaxID=3366817 RepID=UPI003D70F4C7
MRTSSIDGSAVAIVGEGVAAAIKEAVQDDPKAYGLAEEEEEEADALKALSAALSAVEGFGNQIAVLVCAERSVRERLRPSAAFPAAGHAPTA